MSTASLFFKAHSYNPDVFTVDKVPVTVCGGHAFAIVDENAKIFDITLYLTVNQVWKKFPLLDAFKTTGGGIADNSCPITAGIVCRQN
jgi:hypothetical protein